MAEERELQGLGWCIVEIFGHRKLGAQCREVALAGGCMLRCDVPATDETEGFTQLYGAAALFCVSPCSEVAARAIAARYAAPPLQRYELPAATREVAQSADFYDDPDDDAPY